MRTHHLFTFLLSFLVATIHAQDIHAIEKQLYTAYRKIGYWGDLNRSGDNPHAYDSLEKANEVFAKRLLTYTAGNAQTLTHAFKTLQQEGLTIAGSADGLFRIYTWNKLTGGTMQMFGNVFQYRAGSRLKAYVANAGTGGDAGCVYKKISDIEVRGRKYYLTQSVAVLSSALTYHTLSVFTIEAGKLQPGKLIKTRTGMRSQLAYEVDLSASVNRDSEEIPDFQITYDPVKKEISIPLIQADAKITSKRIRYIFTGNRFERQ